MCNDGLIADRLLFCNAIKRYKMANELVFKGQNDQVLTNSILVAEKFCKEHSDVVRAIDNLLQNADNECDAKVQNMFVEYSEDVPQPNGGVKPARRFIMNRDGFTLLAMGFNGKKALKFKLEYIAAFNAMEKALKQHLSSAQMFAMQANINLEYEKRIENVENEIAAIKKNGKKTGNSYCQYLCLRKNCRSCLCVTTSVSW